MFCLSLSSWPCRCSDHAREGEAAVVANETARKIEFAFGVQLGEDRVRHRRVSTRPGGELVRDRRLSASSESYVCIARDRDRSDRVTLGTNNPRNEKQLQKQYP